MILTKNRLEQIVKQLTEGDKNQLTELVGGDMFSDGGDKGVSTNTEIETGPTQKDYKDKSYYKKGIPTVTDKVTGRYRQDIPWFAVYNIAGVRNVTT